MEENEIHVPLIEEPRAQLKIILTLGFVVFLSVLNGTMFNVAVPDISEEFALLPSEVSWVITGYIVVFAVGSATYGKLSDIYQIRTLITLGLVIMSVGSAVGFFAKLYPMLVMARVVQAAGGSAIPALAILVATKYFPKDMTGRVLGALAASVALGAGVGPIAGGYVAGAWHWRFLFPIPILTLFAIPLFRVLLPHDGSLKHTRFDLTGAILLSSAVAAVLVFVTQILWWLLPVSAVFLAWFAIHIHRAESPFIRPSLFSNKRYTMGLVMIFLSMGTIFGMLFMTPIMLREVNGLGTFAIGLVFFPGAMGAAVLGPPGGKLADRVGSARVVYLGLGILAAGFLIMSFVSGAGKWTVAAGLIVCYAAFSLLQASTAGAVAESLPREEKGVGMGLYNLIFFMSGAFGAALIGKLLDVSGNWPAINPLIADAKAAAYSNIYLMFTASVVVSTMFFHSAYKRKG